MAYVPLAAPRQAEGLATLPTGFSDTLYAGAFGGRLTTMTFAPDGRLFVAQKEGAVRIVKNGNLLPQPFLTIPVSTESERGLKGIAFDPNYSINRFVYIYYTDAQTQLNKVSRFTAFANDPDLADPASELVLVDGIASGVYHSGGALHFGPDGKLYISTGDASYGPNSQQLGNLNGKILRLDPNGSIPTDNPFVGQANARPEIWAYGLRNPYTFAFQPGTAVPWINDVGYDTWEEINVGSRGANYGWPTCEGPCANPSFVNPLYAYRHDEGPGKAITGAVFYTGSQFPASYAGDYFFGDYVGHYIKRYDVQTAQVSTFATNALYPVDLDVGPDGALYYLSVERKEVHRINYAAAPPPGGGGVSLTPIADDHTSARAPNQNYGRSSLLYASSGSDSSNIYMKWDLAALAGKQITGATLRFHTASAAAAGSVAAQNVRLVDDTAWQELSLTHANRPPMSTVLGNVASVGSNSDYNVALALGPIQSRVGGLLSLGIESANPHDTMSVHSRDNSTNRPQLVIEFDDSPPPPTGQPPRPVIELPLEGDTFRAGDSITFAGGATDDEDGSLAAAALTWEVAFHHNTHTHPFIEPFSGQASGSAILPDTGESAANVWYRILLTATDSDGNSASVSRDILPQTADVTLDSVPSGLTLLLDGNPHSAPYTFTGVQRFKRQLTAPITQSLNGRTYEFVNWSDGGAADHQLVTPDADATISATYRDITPAGTTLAADTFSRSVAAGWGTADSGGAYVLEGSSSNFSVNGDTGSVTLPAAGANRAAILNTVSARDVDIRVRVRTDRVALGGSYYAYLVVRRSATDSYRPKIILASNGTVSVHAGVVVNNVETSLGSTVAVAGLKYTAGGYIWLRAQVIGANPTTIRVKAWADGQSEPAAWQFSATNSAASLQVSGSVGLRAYISRGASNAPVRFDFDDFAVDRL